MRLRSIQINNLNNIIDSGELILSPNINIIIGENNSGKSTIINAIYYLAS